LSGYHVISLAEYQHGYLWIGTDGGGLKRYDRNTDSLRHFQHQPDNPISLADDLVGVLFVNRSSLLWVGRRMGLDHYDPDKGGFTHHEHDPDDPNSMVYTT